MPRIVRSARRASGGSDARYAATLGYFFIEGISKR
jgi:hypothetical protein